MTDITYPSPPNLQGSGENPPEDGVKPVGAPIVPAYKPALLPNPYQPQYVNTPAPQPYLPPQNYPDIGPADNIIMAATHVETPSPDNQTAHMSENSLPAQGGEQDPSRQDPSRQDPSRQDPSSQDLSGSTFELISEGPQKLLEDVKWSNFKTPDFSVNETVDVSNPQTAQPQNHAQPYNALNSHANPHANPHVNLNPVAGYPPMPQFVATSEASGQAAAQNPYGLPPIAQDPLAPEAGKAPSGLKAFGARLALFSKKNKSKNKTSRAEMPAAQNQYLQDKGSNSTAYQNVQYEAPSNNVWQSSENSNTENLAAIKPSRSARSVFFMGMLSGLILGFLLLTVLGKITADKEYATVSQNGAAKGQFEKLNDDIDASSITKTSDISKTSGLTSLTITEPAQTRVASGANENGRSFLDSQLSRDN